MDSTSRNIPTRWKRPEAIPDLTSYPRYPPPVPLHITASPLWNAAFTCPTARKHVARPYRHHPILEWKGDIFIKLVVCLRLRERHPDALHAHFANVCHDLKSSAVLSCIALDLGIHRVLYPDDHAHGICQSVMEDAMESVAGIGTQDPGDISSTREWLGVVLDPWIDTFYDLRRRPVTCGDGDACLEPRATLSDIPEYNKAMQLFGGDVLEHVPLPLPPSFPAASWPVLCEALTNPGAPTVVTGLTQSNGGLRLIGIMVFEWVLVCMVSRWCSMSVRASTLQKVREVIERSCPWEDLAVGMGIQSLVVHTPVNGSSVTKKQLQSAGRSVLAAVCLTHGLVEAVDWAIRLVRDKTQAAHDAMPADLQHEMYTTSNALSRILYLLGLHPDAQNKLREELIEAGAPDNLDYDLLDRLPYLEAVCRETLRLHAPVRFLQRVARQDHVLPLQEPILDVNGKILSEVFVPKGTAIYCNIIAVNTDPAIWGPDAKEWKPERWLNPLPESVTSAHIPGIYTNTLTFAGGSRSCIGFKFSQLEMKVMLSQFLPAFRFEPSEKHEIIWRFGGIVTPATKAGSQGAKSELPLRISCL